MLLLLGCGLLGDFDIVSSTSYVRKVPQAQSLKALNDFVRSMLEEVSDHRHGAFSFGHCRQLAKRFELNEVRTDSG
jgi:hypothetical protein